MLVFLLWLLIVSKPVLFFFWKIINYGKMSSHGQPIESSARGYQNTEQAEDSTSVTLGTGATVVLQSTVVKDTVRGIGDRLWT